jgi:hypothetical protein
MRACAICGADLDALGKRPDAETCGGACRAQKSRRDRGVRYVAKTHSAPRTPQDGALERLKPSARRVLRALTAAGAHGLTTHQLCQPDVGGLRFGARIDEIRKAGLAVGCVRERAASSRYTLLAREYQEQAA